MSGSKPDRFEKARLEKLKKIEELKQDPWGQRFDDHLPIADVREQCPTESGVLGDSVRIAGRIMLRRKAGKLRFFDIKDQTGSIQLLFSRGDLEPEQWELQSALDLGDLIGIDGKLKRTDTGEVSVFVEKLTVLCKSLAQPPEKFHGAKDKEMLLRQRYLDLIYNDGVIDRMLKRSKIIDSVRNTLREHKFNEVETPVLHSVAGGAAARPFTTHHNALDMELYLRIALELHLKRLMVGGIERVFEIGRVFRNEGVDATHNPEFTMIEIYQAYGDYRSMMDLTEAIVVNAIKTLGDDMVLPWTRRDADGNAIEEKTIDFTAPWPRMKYADLFKEHAGVDMHDAEAVKSLAKSLEIETDGVHPDVIVNEVFEAKVEDALVGPVFVIDYPASICPLTKRKQDDPNIAERFELFIHGMELANAYTELNDPRLQEELFMTQLEGLSDEDSMAKMDTDFIKALKVGMPPAGGLGIGIDRLVMLLTDSNRIGDVIYFPLLRPEGSGKGDKKKKKSQPESKFDQVYKDISTQLDSVKQEMGDLSDDIRKKSAEGIRGLMGMLGDLLDPDDEPPKNQDDKNDDDKNNETE
jgi:lysyl-tRNA synthetase class 2